MFSYHPGYRYIAPNRTTRQRLADTIADKCLHRGHFRELSLAAPLKPERAQGVGVEAAKNFRELSLAAPLKQQILRPHDVIAAVHFRELSLAAPLKRRVGRDILGREGISASSASRPH